MLLDEYSHAPQQPIQELNERYTDLFNICPVAIFILNKAGVILKVNQAGGRLFDLEISSLLNKNFSRYIAPNYQHEFTQYRKILIKKMDVQLCELKLLHKYKPLFYAQVSGKASMNSATGDIELLLIIANLTSRAQSNRLPYQKQIDTITPIATMIADLNQPLTIIANYIYGCIHRIESGKFQTQNLLQAMKQAEHELHRMAEIIIRMKNFSRKEIFKYEPISINSVIEEIITEINHEIIEYPVTIIFKARKNIPDIMLDKMYIQQAILNLARNAIDAMEDVKQTDPRLIIEIERPDKNNIAINLIDNGPGFKLECVHKLFDPHYTSKSYGMGLGLIMSRIIIEAHGGKLLLGLNPVRGACLTIFLPTAISSKPS